VSEGEFKSSPQNSRTFNEFFTACLSGISQTGLFVVPLGALVPDGSDTMTKSVRLMCLPLGLLIVLFAGLQSRSMSPRMYNLLERTAVLIGNIAMYENMPASAFDWSY
jgi:hypothetical protein